MNSLLNPTTLKSRELALSTNNKSKISSQSSAKSSLIGTDLRLMPYYTHTIQRISFKNNTDTVANLELGAHYDPVKGLSFAVESAHATRMELCIFDKQVNGTEKRIPLEKSGDKWGVVLSPTELSERGLTVGQGMPVYYGFRAWGPNWTYEDNWEPDNAEKAKKGFISDVDDNGNRFNPNKLLTDPYGIELSHDPKSPEVQKPTGLDEIYKIYASGPQFRHLDSGKLGPKSIFVLKKDTYTKKEMVKKLKGIGLISPESNSNIKQCMKNWGIKSEQDRYDDLTFIRLVEGFSLRKDGKTDAEINAALNEVHCGTTKPQSPFEKDVIDEAHLRGLTMNDDSIPAPLRGTYLAAALKAKYLHSLGITMVEFLPIQETQNDANDSNIKINIGGHEYDDHNYWGYNTLGFFSPERRYAYDKSPGGPTREFKAMVKAFMTRE